jgi:putative membrane protein
LQNAQLARNRHRCITQEAEPNPMRIFKVLLALSLSIVFSSALFAQDCADTSSGGLAYSSSLSGSQFGGSGSSTGSGTGCFTIDPSNNTGRVRFGTTGISGGGRTASLVRRNSNGTTTKIMDFTNDENTFGQDGSFQLEDIGLSQSLVNEILANPGNFSLMVGNDEFPDGAITGSLRSSRSYSGTLSGRSVVGSTGSVTGGGSFTADIVPNSGGSGSLLNYSFTPSGIGNSITSLGLYEGMSGTDGTLAQALSGSASLTNGRLTGSVELSDEMARELTTNPGGFYLSASTAQFPQGAVRAQFAATEHELFLPVAGTAPGVNGSHWQTDLQILNQSWGGSANATVQMLGSRQMNAANGSIMASDSANVNVLARATSSQNDALDSLYGLSNGLGALRIVSDQPVIAVARIYDRNGPHADGGSTAQPIYAMSRDEALTHGVLLGAPAGSDDTTSRTNLGFFNPNNETATVHLTWQSGRGTNSGDDDGTGTLTLRPYEHMQMPLSGTNGAFDTQQSSAAGGSAVTFHASVPVFAYSSVINNHNGDAHVLMAKEDRMGGGMTDAEIAGIMTVANQGEVEQGNAALSRTSDAEVRAYAQQMVTEHGAALSEAQTVFTQAGITPVENDTAASMRAQSQQIVTQLNSMSGANADRYYMESQVMVHSALLSTIDSLLLPSAQSAALRNMLQTQRAQVAMHLQEARDMLSDM